MIRLENEMGRLGVSQTELAEMTGINRVSINRMLRGKEAPWPKWRDSIAKAINWPADSVDELFEEV